MSNHGSQAPMSYDINDLESIYTCLIEYMNGQLNESDNGTVQPTFVALKWIGEQRLRWTWFDARQLERDLECRFNDLDLRGFTHHECNFVIYVEPVWFVLREVSQKNIGKPLDASIQADRQACLQIRIASADTLAVANCPIRYAFSSWRLQKVQLVFPQMTFNEAGTVTYRLGADA